MDELGLEPPALRLQGIASFPNTVQDFSCMHWESRRVLARPPTPIPGHRSSNEFLDYQSRPHPMQIQKHSPKPHVKLVGL